MLEAHQALKFFILIKFHFELEQLQSSQVAKEAVQYVLVWLIENVHSNQIRLLTYALLESRFLFSFTVIEITNTHYINNCINWTNE